MKKKVIPAVLLAFSLLCCLLAPPAFAAEEQVPPAEAYWIPEEVAQLVASYFVRDCIGTQDNRWTEGTQVARTVTMYDSLGNVSAYTCELEDAGQEKGYIVISADPRAENAIKEYSDAARPLYESFDLRANDSVVYMGALDYYQDNGTSTLLALDGQSVEKEDIVVESTLRPTELSSRIIINIKKYAERIYGGIFNPVEYVNNYEYYCPFYAGDGAYYPASCGPTSITNLTAMLLNYNRGYNMSASEVEELFYQIEQYGIDQGYYTREGGTRGNDYDIMKYITESLWMYGGLSYRASYEDGARYESVKGNLQANSPMILSLSTSSNSGYTNETGHMVQAYACTRWQSETTGYYKSFVKIQDGKGDRTPEEPDRFLDFSDIDEPRECTVYTIY